MKVAIALLIVLPAMFFQLHAQENTNNPLAILQQETVQNGWLAYKVPAQDNTRSMCCLNHGGISIKIKGNSNYDFKSCDLNKKSQGYGTSNNSPLTENINIYMQIKHGKIKQILSTGDACEIKKSGQTVSWLNNISEKTSIDFLAKTARLANDQVVDALYAISKHNSKGASQSLYEFALKNKTNDAEKSIFWLGEARHDGVDYLHKLYKELPNGDVKQQINFALSLANNKQAVELLKTIILTDVDKAQRKDALFWLVEVSPENGKQIIMHIPKSR